MEFPQNYMVCCFAINGGQIIEHDPRAAYDDPVEKSERLRRTKVVYKIIFGEEAPIKFWPGARARRLDRAVSPQLLSPRIEIGKVDQQLARCPDSGFQVFVKTLTGRTMKIDVPTPNMRVEAFKVKIQVNFISLKNLQFQHQYSYDK